MKTSVAISTLAVAILTISNPPAGATLLLSQNFSSYADGNLVGQNGWNQVGITATLPIQVSGGKVVMPAGQTADNQDAWIDMSPSLIGAPISGVTTIYYGLDMSVQSAPVLGAGGIAAPSYFAAQHTEDQALGFVNERLTAIDFSASVPNTYHLGARITGQILDPFSYGRMTLAYNKEYTVVVEANMSATENESSLKIYVDGALLLTHPIGQGASDPTGIGSFVLSQFANATTGNVGVTISAIRIADNLAEASGVPEPATMLLASSSLLGWVPMARSRRRKESSG